MQKYIKDDSFLDIAYELNRDPDTVSKFCDMLRSRVIKYIINLSRKLGGYDEHGRSKIVEIDESMFFKRKYNVGRLKNN